MRMRRLGYSGGQSVMFYAPPEVDRRIRTSQGIEQTQDVRVIDALSWVMGETCAHIEHHIPHWIEQGVDYNRRSAANQAFASVTGADVERLRESWLQPAARSLEDMYGVASGSQSLIRAASAFPTIQQRLEFLGVTQVRDARMEEEQEREVDHEVELELQLERPPRVPAAKHRLDDDVRHFVHSGVVRNNSRSILPLMSPLSSGGHRLHPPNPWSKSLFSTRDFMTTTAGAREMTMLTEYLRPVNWILSTTQQATRMFVVISPFEANELLPDIRTSRYVRLHMYAPRTIQSMKSLDNLGFYCVPPLPADGVLPISPSLDIRCQINLWAGQLYLDKYETYLRLCLLLGLSSSDAADALPMESDRFVKRENRTGEMAELCLLEKSPLPLLKQLFVLRRKGMNHAPTHMGKIMHARILTNEDFQAVR